MAELVRQSRWKRLWLSEHVHVWVWLLLTFAYLVWYLFIHVHCHEKYEKSIKTELLNAVKIYNWRAHPRTGVLELMVGDTPYSQSAPSDSGPLGIGALPSVRGLLVDAHSAFDSYNTALSTEILRILDGFELSSANRNQMRIELSVVAPELARRLAGTAKPSGRKCCPPQEREGAESNVHRGTLCHKLRAEPDGLPHQSKLPPDHSRRAEDVQSIRPPKLTTGQYPDGPRGGASESRTKGGEERNKETCTAGGDGAEAFRQRHLVLEVPADTIADLRNEFPDERTARGLLAALKGGVVKDVHVDVSRDANGSELVDAVIPTVITGKAHWASNEVCRRFTVLGDPLRDVLFKQVVAGRLSERRACVFRGIGQDVIRTGVSDAGDEPTDRPRQACSSQDERRCFHDTLSVLVKENPGFFWTIGPYRWLEFALIAGAGVLLRRLTEFGKDYARLLQGVHGSSRNVTPERLPVWEPRESVRTVVYFFSAPVIALVIILILAWTELLSIDSAKLGDLTSSAAIPLAFLLGFFPDIGPLVLTRVVRGVFGDVSDTEARRRKPPAAETVATGGPDAGGDSPPSFAAFRARLRAHATRPFRGGGDDPT